MILAIDTSAPTCVFLIVTDTVAKEYTWEAGRGLADGMLKYLRDRLFENDAVWDDLTGIVAYKGPGSFTGLRIGLTVVNTIADSTGIPIVGVTEKDWIATGIARLKANENDELVMPLYGREPNITTPRK